MAWYYKDGDQEIGPIEKQQLQELITAKRIGRQTLVRNSTMNEWKPLAEFARNKQKTESAQPPPAANASQSEAAAESKDEAPAPPDSLFCSQCGRPFPRDEVVTFGYQVICADCKPMFVQKLKEGAAPTESFGYAGFWIRFGAKIIDSLLLGAVNFMIILPLSVLVGLSGMTVISEEGDIQAGYFLFMAIQQLISIAIPACYNTFFIGRFGATLGKMACGIKVVMPSGGRVSYLRALGRNFAEWLSSLTLCIGYIIAAFDGEKRALHDHICSTRVVYK